MTHVAHTVMAAIDIVDALSRVLRITERRGITRTYHFFFCVWLLRGDRSLVERRMFWALRGQRNACLRRVLRRRRSCRRASSSSSAVTLIIRRGVIFLGGIFILHRRRGASRRASNSSFCGILGVERHLAMREHQACVMVRAPYLCARGASCSRTSFLHHAHPLIGTSWHLSNIETK